MKLMATWKVLITFFVIVSHQKFMVKMVPDLDTKHFVVTFLKCLKDRFKFFNKE